MSVCAGVCMRMGICESSRTVHVHVNATVYVYARSSARVTKVQDR